MKTCLTEDETTAPRIPQNGTLLATRCGEHGRTANSSVFLLYKYGLSVAAKRAGQEMATAGPGQLAHCAFKNEVGTGLPQRSNELSWAEVSRRVTCY